MGTISKVIADQFIAGTHEENRPTKIIKYENPWGVEMYGLLFAHEDQDRYAPSHYVRNPTVYWVHP